VRGIDVKPFLLLIAVLVFVGAAATSADEQARTVLSTQHVGNACSRHAIVLGEGDRLRSVVRTSYQPVAALMTTCPRADAADSLADLRATLEGSGAQVAAVYDQWSTAPSAARGAEG
jgi:hypothetical protein